MEVHCSFLSTSVREALWKSIKNRSRDFTGQDCSNILLGLANMQFSADLLVLETFNYIKEWVSNVKSSEFTIQVRKKSLFSNFYSK
jgi:hypothetical protein